MEEFVRGGDLEPLNDTDREWGLAFHGEARGLNGNKVSVVHQSTTSAVGDGWIALYRLVRIVTTPCDQMTREVLEEGGGDAIYGTEEEALREISLHEQWMPGWLQEQAERYAEEER